MVGGHGCGKSPYFLLASEKLAPHGGGVNIYKSLILLALTVLVTSCNEQANSPSTEEKNGLQVVCTVGMISNLAQEITGDHATVTNIIGEGADPHVYKHTSKDVKLLQSADLILFNGYHLEGKMEGILKKMNANGKAAYAVAEAVVSHDALLKDEEGADDPHLWMDVSQWRRVAQYVHQMLVEQLPAQKEDLDANYNDLDQRLDQLHHYCQQTLATIPANQRFLVTAHDAFGYMESAYGLNVRGIQGLSTESEAGLKDLEDLIVFLKEKQIPAVFIESSVNDKNVKALIEGAQAQGHKVKIGGELFSDAMGAPNTYEGTYIGMIDHNVTTITRALGGKAPAEGCFGKLSNH